MGAIPERPRDVSCRSAIQIDDLYLLPFNTTTTAAVVVVVVVVVAAAAVLSVIFFNGPMYLFLFRVLTFRVWVWILASER